LKKRKAIAATIDYATSTLRGCPIKTEIVQRVINQPQRF